MRVNDGAGVKVEIGADETEVEDVDREIGMFVTVVNISASVAVALDEIKLRMLDASPGEIVLVSGGSVTVV